MSISNQTNFHTSSGSLFWPYFDCALLLLWSLLGCHCSLLIGFPLQNVASRTMRFATLHASKHEYNAMASFQTTANIGKTRDKYCLLWINQSVHFKERFKLQFTNIYKYILFLHDILMMIAIMKTNEPLEYVILKGSSWIVAVFTMSWVAKVPLL